MELFSIRIQRTFQLVSTICLLFAEKIANKRYKISFTTYLLAKVHYINLLIDYHFLFLGFVSSFVRY